MRIDQQGFPRAFEAGHGLLARHGRAVWRLAELGADC
jgi:hypothetical protein